MHFAARSDETELHAIDSAGIIAYNACMNHTQYTIRSIPPKVDTALRRRAQQTGRSLNEVVVEALAKGAGVTPDETFTDLDWFIGNNSLDASFDESMER